MFANHFEGCIAYTAIQKYWNKLFPGRQDLKQKLTKAKFFSLLLDGSTLIMKLSIAVWYDPEGGDKKVHTQMQYFTIV